jgi:hypothetical protein
MTLGKKKKKKKKKKENEERERGKQMAYFARLGGIPPSAQSYPDLTCRGTDVRCKQQLTTKKGQTPPNMSSKSPYLSQIPKSPYQKHPKTAVT